jgi:uncharacterized protein YdeI (YjbR/CyaY-like superfamily)
MTGDGELVTARDRAAWRRWLQRNHTDRAGASVEFHKKGSAGRSITYEEAVEEALCFGWIDSKPKKLDDDRWALWFAPRKPKGVWSAINKGRVERLVADDRMTEAGFAAIEVAKANGAWDTLNDSDALLIPDDLAAAFDARVDARRHWDGFPPSVRKQILSWITSAKREGTRAKRVDETARSAAQNVRAHQWRPKT